MTPQERQLLSELFDRLASLEKAPRDPEAVTAIEDGLQRAPSALYPLVQTVLVQDEALKRAEAHIRELESELAIAPEQPARQGGFLDSMRNTLSSGRESQGSVPTVRPGAGAPRASVWGSGQTLPAGYRAAQESGSPGYGPAQAGGSPGGSFLGTAAATAAGVVGGTLLMNSLRGMFGGQHGQAHAGFNPGGQGGTPWGPNSGSGGNLSRQAGIDDIGRSGSSQGFADGSQRASLLDTAKNDAGESDFEGEDFDDNTNFGDDGDTA